MTKEFSSAPMSADDAFDAAVAIARNVVAKPPEGERLNRALEHVQFVLTPWRQRNPVEWSQLNQAASEFAAPYLACIAELETEARRNRIAIDALTESGKASAGIIAKLESDNKALHDAIARATMDSLGKAIQGEPVGYCQICQSNGKLSEHQCFFGPVGES